MIQKPFSLLASEKAPARLRLRVSAGIVRARARRSLVRRIAFGATSLVSLAAAWYSLVSLAAALKASGMYEYLSILLSVNGGFGSYAKELALSLLEALPAVALAATLAAVTLFVWSSIGFVRSSRHRRIAFA